MGSVWVATDTKLRREVAVKLLAKTYAADVAARNRFEREAMSVAKLSSAHIVQIFDYGVDGDTPFITMELLAGEDLRRRLSQKKLLSIGEMHRIVAQVAAGLTEAHNAGVVHRDLKPGNIFLAKTQTGEIAKLLDFGVAKPEGEVIEEELTAAGSVVGTPQYMSPEQIRALPTLDHRSDLFSLGVIIYRALVGRLPFEGRSVNDLSVNIATQDVPPPSTLAHWLPPEIDAFMLRALAKRPEERFSNAREMSDAFGTLVPGSMPGLDAPSLSGALGSSASWPAAPSGVGSYAGTDSMSSISVVGAPPSTASGVASMSSTAQAALLAAADSEIALQQRPPWGRRIAVAIAILLVTGLCLLIARVLFDEGPSAAAPSATATAAATTPEPIAESPPPASASETSEPPPSTAPKPKPAPVAPGPRPPTAAPPPSPPTAPASEPKDTPWDPFKNRK